MNELLPHRCETGEEREEDYELYGAIPPRRNDKNRFIISKATQNEFGLKDSDVPMSMRRKLDESVNYTNHVDQNIRVVKRFNDINKVVYLSKIKFSIEN